MIPRASLPTSDHTNVDQVLLTLGGYSNFQLWASFVILAPEVPAAMMAMLPVFVGAQYNGADSKNCSNFYSYVTDNRNYTNGEIRFLSNSSSVSCSDQIGIISMRYSSVIDEWDLVGSFSWITETFTSIFMGGMMTGAFLASQLADRYGRKKIFFYLLVMIVVFGTASALAPNPYVYAVTRYFAGIGVGGYYCIYSIYLMEFLTPSWRVICGSVGFWFLGEMLLALSAYYISSWRILSLVPVLPAFMMLFTYPWIPETPRWLLCHNDTKNAEKVLQQIAKWNGKSILDKSVIDNLQKSVRSNDGAETGNATGNSLLTLWRIGKLRLQLVIFIISFFSVAFTYYGISFNAKNLSGDPYLNMFYMGLIDMIAFPIGAVFSNRFGRRMVSSTFLTFATLSLLVLIVLEMGTSLVEEYAILVTVLCFLARFGVAAAWGVIICFNAESFPTVVRSTALGICNLMANTGGVIAPQIAFVGALWPVVPHIVFCALIMLTVGLSWLLKEMNGQPLEDFVS